VAPFSTGLTSKRHRMRLISHPVGIVFHERSKAGLKALRQSPASMDLCQEYRPALS